VAQLKVDNFIYITLMPTLSQSTPSEPDFLILGATGMQGSIVVRDLVESGFSVVASSDISTHLSQLKQRFPSISTYELDLRSEKNLYELLTTTLPQVIINCAEGDWDMQVYQAALEIGINVIDLGSEIPMTKDQLALDSAFKNKQKIAITGVGSTPGINNIMLDYAVSEFDEIATIEAGFAWNSNIQKFVVPFSMESVIEEFTYPVDFVENGKWVQKQPLETLQEKNFREIGPQKVFMVRHPEPYTFCHYYQNKGVKNCRFYAGFPEHSFNKILSFIQGYKRTHHKSAYVDNIPMQLSHLTDILRKEYPQPDGYKEKEILWVLIEGKQRGKAHSVLMECLVPPLPDWEEAGCNIDTGFPASIIAQMILKGDIKKFGSFAPEAIVPHKLFFTTLARKNMSVWRNGKQLF